MTAPTFALVIAAVVSSALATLLLKQYALSPVRVPIAGLSVRGSDLARLALLFYPIAFFVHAMVLRTLNVGKAHMVITLGAEIVLMLLAPFPLKRGLVRWHGPVWLRVCPMAFVAQSKAT
jgi:hypothetical protein